MQILLPNRQLPDRSGNLGRCQQDRRNLIEQRLKDVVTTPSDQRRPAKQSGVLAVSADVLTCCESRPHAWSIVEEATCR
jgi:hypothetical protein